jgi:hypothetical protein
MDQGQEVGPAALPWSAESPDAAAPHRPAAPSQLAQTSHKVSVTKGNTAANDPDRRNKVDSIQRTRLASLGSMDPQTSEQPTWGNNQHIYT